MVPYATYRVVFRATLDEGSWISTAYLVAEIIVIPLSGWISRVCSLKRYMMGATILFIVFAICCALAWDLKSMIAFRALQGISGGAFVPMAFMVIINKLPPAKRAAGMALFSASMTMGPSIGPTIGGWITDNWNWHWIFAINVLPGALMIAMIWCGIEAEPCQFHLLRDGDWAGIIAMTTGLGALEVVLEEGERNNWFDSDYISPCGEVAAVGLVVFVYRELTARVPFINLRLLKRRRFCLATIANFIFGVGLFGVVFLAPLYLTQMRNDSPFQIGLVLMWIGIPQVVISPLVPRLLQRFDARVVAFTGMSLFGISSIMNGFMTHDSSGDQFVWSNIVRTIGQPLVMVPLNTLATVGVEKEQSASASGLFNVTRYLGGSIGIAALATILSEREKLHSNRLCDALTSASAGMNSWLSEATRYLLAHGDSAKNAGAQAMALLGQSVRTEAFISAYNDDFLYLGLLLLAGGIIVCFLPRYTHPRNMEVKR